MAHSLEVDSIPVAKLSLLNGDPEFKRQLAKRNVGEPSNSDVNSLVELVDRVLSNIFYSVEDLSRKCACPNLTELLKVPIPYDSANPMKKSVYLEMMPTVGKDPLWRKIWTSAFSPALETGPQQSGKNIVLVTGVSGMGKTKAAYDIGRRHAFAVVTRIVELDRVTTSWQCLLSFASTFVTSLSSNPPIAERLTLKSVVILFMIAHLDYLEDITNQALLHPDWKQYVAKMKSLHKCETQEKAADLLLKEIVLRSQRNGFAYADVSNRFRKRVHSILDSTTCFNSNGEIALSEEYALEQFKTAMTKLYVLWGEDAKVVWVYDEIQALQHVDRFPNNLFAGVYSGSSYHLHPSQEIPVKSFGWVYGLLAAIRSVLTVASHGHVLLGNSWDISHEILATNSPAQDRSAVFEESVHLQEEDVSELLSYYLSDDVMASLHASDIRQLCGRPLFASFYWTQLISTAKLAFREGERDLKKIANQALQETIAGATKDACVRIDAMWSSSSPAAGCSRARPGLLAYMFHASIMCTDSIKGVAHYKSDLQVAILRGILNGRKDDDSVSLEREPITKDALLSVGRQRLKWNTDGVMELLNERITMPMGGEKCDYGEALEACFAWALMRKFLLAKGDSLSLKSLLEDFLDHDASCNDYPELLDEYHVRIDSGCHWGAQAKDLSPFEVMDTQPCSMVHHPDDKMAGPDIMHLAVRNNGQPSDTKPVIYQLRNGMATGTLVEAAASLNIACMHPDILQGGKGPRLQESPAHASMRKVLEKHSAWQQPFRVIVSTKPHCPAVLHHVAWFNRNQWYDSPLVLLVVNAENLGVNLPPHSSNGSYSVPIDWRELSQGKLRYSSGPASSISDVLVSVSKSPPGSPDGHEVWSVSLKVKMSWPSLLPNLFRSKQSKDAILSRLRVLGYGEFSAKWPRSESAVVLTFTNFADARRLVETQPAVLSNRQCTFSFYK